MTAPLTQAVPLWARIVDYARRNADPAGTVWLDRAQLRRTIAPHARPDHLARAVSTAVRYGYLAEGSTTRLLILQEQR